MAGSREQGNIDELKPDVNESAAANGAEIGADSSSTAGTASHPADSQTQNGRDAPSDAGTARAVDATVDADRGPLADLRDAPPDHPIWKMKILWQSGHTCYAKVGPDKIRIQTTLKASGGKEMAERVLRLCCMYYEENNDREKVVQYRDDIYRRLAEARGDAQPEKKARKETKPKEVKPEAKPEVKPEVKAEMKEEVKAEKPAEKEQVEDKKEKKDKKDKKEKKDKKDKKEDKEAKKVAKQVKKEGKEEAKAEAKLDAKAEVKTEVKNENSGEDLEDAPAGHVAWTRIHYWSKVKTYNLDLGKLENGGKTARIAVSVDGMANGNDALAQRIARLCYVKFADGASKEEVLQYRDELVEKNGGKLRGTGGRPHKRKADAPEASPSPEATNGAAPNGNASAPAAKPPPPRKKVKKEQPPAGEQSLSLIIEQLRAEDRLDGALRLHGREESKKNALINGVYAPMEESLHGKPVYKKVNDAGQPRILYWYAAKKRWKVSDTLGDSSAGFAFVKYETPMAPLDLPADVKWQVFDGKEKGFHEDPDFRCDKLQAVVSSTTAASNASSDKESDSESEESSSQGSSDDSDQASPSEPPPPQPSPLASPGEIGNSTPRLPQVREMRVCRKMLVVCHLRDSLLRLKKDRPGSG